MTSLDALVNNLSDNDFRYLSEEFSRDLLELVKQKGVYPYEFLEDKLPDKCKFFRKINVSVKKIIHMPLMFGMCLK